jgi:hypothetical protein
VGEEEDEIERLLERVAALESELIEVRAWANREVADAQAKTYWLERWHIDLNEIMRQQSATRIRAVLRAIRSVVRALRRLKWRLLP